jgi:hypothetical protein
MFRHRSVISRVLAGLLLVAGCSCTASASAQDLVKQVNSLKWIPANAGSYSTMLRNKEQIDIVLNSKAVAKLMALPYAQKAKKDLETEMANPGGPFAPILDWYGQKGNADLVAMLGDLTSDEIFMYADKNCADFFALYQDVYSTVNLAPFTRILKDGPQGAFNDPNFQMRVALQSLSENVNKLKFPDFVIGFKFTKTKAAELNKTIEDGLKMADMMAPPPFQGRLKKTVIHGADVHSLTLDGSLVPWDMVPFKDLEEIPGQFNKLRKKLKELQMTFSLSVRDNFLLFSFGEGTAGLQALGAPGKKLIEQPEFAPVVKLGNSRFTSIAYASKEYRTITADIFSLDATGGGFKMDDAMKYLDGMLRESNLNAVQQAKIRKDFRAMLVDLKRYMPVVGAQLDFNFLTGRGMEGYSYDWSKNHGVDSSKPLTILDHVGGQPIAFYASRSPVQGQLDSYADLVKYVKLAHSYFEEFALPEMPIKERVEYQKYMLLAMPFFNRLDKATGKMLLPSTDGQGAWVLDAKLKISIPDPAVPQAMPVPEIGVVLGLSNQKLFIEAMTEYRSIFNDVVDLVTKFAPPGAELPDFKIPLPKTKNAAGGTLYSWPLPTLPGLDPKIMPTGAVSDKVAVFGISEDHAVRMLTKTPFKMDGGPLGNTKKPLSSAAYFNWAGLIDASMPWVDLALTETQADQEIKTHVYAVLDVLKCFRTYASATYLDQGAVVVHSEAVFRDLEK